MKNRDTIETYYDSARGMDIEIRTTYEDGRKTIRITVYEGSACVCDFNADYMDTYFLDELEIDDDEG